MTEEMLAKYTQSNETIDQCTGCDHVVENDGVKTCDIYKSPWYKWSVGACNMASHVKTEVVEQAKKLNPLKASKRSAAGR